VSETLDKAGSKHLGDDMPDDSPDNALDDILERAREVDRIGRRLAEGAVKARLARGAA
jgi:hypothetical protein